MAMVAFLPEPNALQKPPLSQASFRSSEGHLGGSYTSCKSATVPSMGA